MSCSFACTSLRAVSSARTSCAGSDLQCTLRNQPSRISWAMPQASFRSVFTGIALKASRTWRVSSNSSASPALARAANSHCDNGPASSPIRLSGTPRASNQAVKGAGSLASFASRTIRPFPSTTHTLTLSNDTSIPAYCSMVVPPMMLGAGTNARLRSIPSPSGTTTPNRYTRHRERRPFTPSTLLAEPDLSAPPACRHDARTRGRQDRHRSRYSERVADASASRRVRLPVAPTRLPPGPPDRYAGDPAP
jgi:hypothetical protein